MGFLKLLQGLEFRGTQSDGLLELKVAQCLGLPQKMGLELKLVPGLEVAQLLEPKLVQGLGSVLPPLMVVYGLK